MGFSEKPAVWTDREPTLDEEIGALDDEDIFDLANLGEDRTGVPGVIMISTVMGSHGPRVKYCQKTGPGQPSLANHGRTRAGRYRAAAVRGPPPPPLER